MSKLLCFAFSAVVVCGFLISTPGCGGSGENSVSAPPAVVVTQEEMAAQRKVYDDEQKKMRDRDKGN